ncbi:DUF4367 domain-containing protein [Senimuribacter intestinalis]|uniref:DUF4367 domain-containing protein n=1 Tax=Senimuribacter intestinalis TaxID=2941507 RepID=UPI0027D9716C|nr:DUF4367 domain-containing protein [Senimuribacter intestinalis]
MEEIGAALKRHEKKTKLDAEVLEGWVAAAKERSRARKRKYMAAISCVVIVCAGTFSAMNLLVPDAAIAGKNGPVTMEDGNSTIVKNNAEDPGANLGGDTMIETEWDKVATVKKNYPDLLIPGYVPEGYEFKELRVEVTEFFNSYSYTYEKEKSALRFTQITSTDLTIIKNYSYSFISNSGVEIKIKEDEEISASFIIDDNTYTIIGNLKEEEFAEIADSLEK